MPRKKRTQQESSENQKQELQSHQTPPPSVTLAQIKEMAEKLNPKIFRIAAQKSGIVLYRGRDEKKGSLIPYRSIIEVVYSPTSFMKQGFVVFVDREGKGAHVLTAADALRNNHAVTYGRSQDKSFGEFLEVFAVYLKRINPSFKGVRIMSGKEGLQKKRESQLKQIK